jgi:myo-inositol-1(or 4)-monophosphatase
MDEFDKLAEAVLAMGRFACDAQRTVARTYKEDGSVLTKTDLAVSDCLVALINELFVGANIVTEETRTPFKEGAELTFVIDPIDGTDVYSQGLPGWAISIGILDKHLQCIGAMVNAPRWGLSSDEPLFLRLDPGTSILLNGIPFRSATGKDVPKQIAMASNVGEYLDLSGYGGKIRCYGSNILHMLSVLVHPNIQGSVSVPCYAWDMAGAHALLLAGGFAVCRDDGTPFVYDHNLLVERLPFEGTVFSGTPAAVKAMRKLLPTRLH